MKGARVYYNENDPHAAQWLRNLIDIGEIAPGMVDERSIEDVRPEEIKNFVQCHFFAGIGVWSHALRWAGWPDDRPVWTGSCPCQGFSAAGKGEGFDDERHLWPAWFHLIQHGKPADIPVFGEQVASKLGLAWLDLVQADMEAAGHAVWPFDICAAGFGAPHIRQRLYFAAKRLADTMSAGRTQGRARAGGGSPARRFGHGGMAEPDGREREWGTEAAGGDVCNGQNAGRSEGDSRASGSGGASRLADTTPSGQQGGAGLRDRESTGIGRKVPADDGGHGQMGHNRRPGPVNGFWRDADWLFCRDGKWRPVEPGTFPLVDGAAFRLGSGSSFEGKSRASMLRGYGNAINAEQAATFIAAYMEST